jgi:hypothetical protein
VALQGIPLFYSRLRRLWQLTGDWAVSGNLTVDGALTLGSTALTPQPAEPMPADHDMVSWSYKPELAVTTLTPVLGTVYLTALPVRTATTVSKLWFLMGAAATTPTAGQSWAGLISPAGTMLSTASLDSIITSGNAAKSATLAAPQAVSPGMYWGALLFNAAAAPVVYKTNSPFLGFANVNQSAASGRYSINGTGRTTLTNIDPSANTAGQTVWMGLS